MSCCGQNHDSKVQSALNMFEQIGKESLLLINENRDKKDETWERAIKINHIAHEAFLALNGGQRSSGDDGNIENISE